MKLLQFKSTNLLLGFVGESVHWPPYNLCHQGGTSVFNSPIYLGWHGYLLQGHHWSENSEPIGSRCFNTTHGYEVLRGTRRDYYSQSQAKGGTRILYPKLEDRSLFSKETHKIRDNPRSNLPRGGKETRISRQQENAK